MINRLVIHGKMKHSNCDRLPLVKHIFQCMNKIHIQFLINKIDTQMFKCNFYLVLISYIHCLESISTLDSWLIAIYRRAKK